MDAVKELKKLLSYPLFKKIEEKFNHGLITYYEFLKTLGEAYQEMHYAIAYLNGWLGTETSFEDMLKGEIEIAKMNVNSPITFHKHEVAVVVYLKTGDVVTYIDNDEAKTIHFDSYKALNARLLGTLDVSNKKKIIKWLCLDSINADVWREIMNREINKEAARAIDEHERIYGADGEKWQASQGLYVI